jgi:hypothetical protein
MRSQAAVHDYFIADLRHCRATRPEHFALYQTIGVVLSSRMPSIRRL